MYIFQITHLDKGQVVQMQVSTNLVSPFTYEGLIIEKKFGTDCILINGEKYQVPVNRMNHTEVNENISVGFGYFLTE